MNRPILNADGSWNGRRRCKVCGRRWKARWEGQFAYFHVCTGCDKRTSDCTCESLPKPEEGGTI